MKACPEFREVLLEMSAGIRPIAGEVAEHMKTCDACRNYFVALRRTADEPSELLERIGEPLVSNALTDRVMARIESDDGLSEPVLVRWRIAAVAGVTIVALFLVTLFRTPPPVETTEAVLEEPRIEVEALPDATMLTYRNQVIESGEITSVGAASSMSFEGRHYRAGDREL